MNKILIFGGLVIMLLGCCATAGFYAVQVTQSFNSTIDTATNTDEKAAQLCKSGEKLTKSKGPSSYDASTGHTASSVTYYCEDSEGHQRDITTEVVGKITGSLGNFFSSMVSIRWEFVIVSLVGLVMTGAGIILWLLRRKPATPVQTL